MAQDQDVLVRYLSDSIRLVEHALRKNATGVGTMHPSYIPQPLTTTSFGKTLQNTSIGIRATSGSLRQPVLTGTPRRPASDVMAFKRTSEPNAQEVQEKLRHSMQSSGSVKWTGRVGSLAAEPNSQSKSHSRQKIVSNTAVASPHANPPTLRAASIPRPTLAAPAAASKTSPATVRHTHIKTATHLTPSNQLPPGLAPMPSTSQREFKQHHAPSEAGSHADWWQRPRSGSSSVISYPMTAVTDRGGSVASTEFRAWMERISQLENAVSDERNKRRLFEEELKKMQSEAPLFAVSRGGLATSKANNTHAGATATGATRSSALAQSRLAR